MLSTRLIACVSSCDLFRVSYSRFLVIAVSTEVDMVQQDKGDPTIGVMGNNSLYYKIKCFILKILANITSHPQFFMVCKAVSWRNMVPLRGVCKVLQKGFVVFQLRSKDNSERLSSLSSCFKRKERYVFRCGLTVDVVHSQPGKFAIFRALGLVQGRNEDVRRGIPFSDLQSACKFCKLRRIFPSAQGTAASILCRAAFVRVRGMRACPLFNLSVILLLLLFLLLLFLLLLVCIRRSDISLPLLKHLAHPNSITVEGNFCGVSTYSRTSHAQEDGPLCVASS